MSATPMADDRDLFAFFRTLADISAEATLPFFRSAIAVEDKAPGTFDPVTEADRACEKAIREAIGERFARDTIVGEEFGTTEGSSSRRWIIDPIDGTRSFMSGIPLWGTLVGLMEGAEAVAGMMAQPFTGELFHAAPGYSVLERYGRTAALGTSGLEGLSEATLFSTDPRLFQGSLASRMDDLRRDVRLVRYGADCYAFAMLAAGRIDLVVEPDLKLYDIAALIPIIRQAGGVVERIDGRPAEEGGDVIAGASPRIVDEARAILVR